VHQTPDRRVFNEMFPLLFEEIAAFAGPGHGADYLSLPRVAGILGRLPGLHAAGRAGAEGPDLHLREQRILLAHDGAEPGSSRTCSTRVGDRAGFGSVLEQGLTAVLDRATTITDS